MPDQPDLPIDDDPPAELDPMGTSQGTMQSVDVPPRPEVSDEDR